MGMQQPWNEDLCGCCNDSSSCCLSCFCPAIQYAYNSQLIDQSSFCGACCEYLLLGMFGCDICLRGSLRRRIRYAYGIQSDCCCDCFVHCVCGCCALAQETREIALRGPPKRMVMMAMQQPIILGSPAPAIMVQAVPTQMPQQMNLYAQSSNGHPPNAEMYSYSQQQQQQQWPQQQEQYPQYASQPTYPPPQYSPQYSQPPPQQAVNDYATTVPATQPVIYKYDDDDNDGATNDGAEGQTMK